MIQCAVHKLLFHRMNRARDYGVFLFLVLLLFPPLATANIYRCVSDSGVVTYSDQPCGENAVVAFDKYDMSVDDAISRDIFYRDWNRKRLGLFQQDIEAHAKLIGNCILPNQKLNSFFMPKLDGNAYNKDWDWTVIMHYGLGNDEREWQITIRYNGKLENEKALFRAIMIRTYKNNRLIEPSTMRNIKALKKIKSGEWKYPGY